jgi:pimeloyl-ACP methyl ester carboxylesterase
MTTNSARVRAFTAVLTAAVLLTACGANSETEDSNALALVVQGSLAVGGTMMTAPGEFDPLKPGGPQGQTYRGDHAYAFYQVPENPRELPLVMLHGAGQFSRTWETTPDGREGFQNLFLRRGFSTYLVDQPRRGNAGRTMVGTTLTPTPDEQMWFNQFRVGTWPDRFPGVQFSDEPEALNQYFQSMTPNTGPYDADVISEAMSALFDQIGDGILFTHSQGGGPGWLAAMKNPR